VLLRLLYCHHAMLLLPCFCGVDPTLVNQKGTEYKTLWRAILMIVHEDKRRPGLSPEREALFNCICKRVNELNSKA
jgi:hypothetical protein